VAYKWEPKTIIEELHFSKGRFHLFFSWWMEFLALEDDIKLVTLLRVFIVFDAADMFFCGSNQVVWSAFLDKVNGFSTKNPPIHAEILGPENAFRSPEEALKLDGGFKYFVFSSLLGEMIQFDEHIFTKGLVQPATRKQHSS